jgi:membrane-associated protease RseP (regulator of RpoE activity)
MISVNTVLCVLNMAPVPMLDGFPFLSAVVDLLIEYVVSELGGDNVHPTKIARWRRWKKVGLLWVGRVNSFSLGLLMISGILAAFL